jgi:hypothetical protein
VKLPAAPRIGLVLPGLGLLALCHAAPAAPQFGGSGALGGPYASRGVSRPLGGFQSPRSPGEFRRGPTRGSAGYGAPYAYSVYVPNYFDSYVDPSWAPMVVPPPLPPQAFAQQPPPAPPVIINQYFVQGGPGVPVNVAGGNAPYPPEPLPAADMPAPGDPIGPVENYYLIAYKNRSVYSALAYWIEGNTLHYVTTQNTHNQASLDLIDIELTKNINRTRNVPFTIPGKP